MKRSNVIYAALMLTVVTVPLLTADVFIKQKVHTDAFSMMGQEQPETDVVQSVWMTERGISTIDAKKSHIILFDKKIQYSINHENKTYTEIPFDFDKILKGITGDEGDTENMQQAMTGWNCTKYIQKITMAMGSIEIDVWASPDIKVEVNIYKKYATAIFSGMPGMQANMKKLNEELQKIKGVTVRSESAMNMMGTTIKTWTEVIELKEGKAPAKVFELPAGYTKTESRMRGM